MDVLVYTGPGAGAQCTPRLMEALRVACPADLRVRGIEAAEIVRGGWEAQCRILVIGGGEDLPMCAALDGEGTRRIREYVAAGGAYLGICAGAYFASAAVRFECPDGTTIAGPRELAFFPGEAAGPVTPHYHPDDAASAVLTTVESPSRRALCWGGPAFVPGPDAHATSATLRYRGDGLRPEARGATAAVTCRVGRGLAVLCGVHPELTPGADGDALLRQLLRAAGVT